MSFIMGLLTELNSIQHPPKKTKLSGSLLPKEKEIEKDHFLAEKNC